MAASRYGKMGDKKRATCISALLQNELDSGVSSFATHVQTCWPPDLLQDRFDVGGKRPAQHRYLTRFAAKLQDKVYVFCCTFFRTFKGEIDEIWGMLINSTIWLYNDVTSCHRT